MRVELDLDVAYAPIASLEVLLGAHGLLAALLSALLDMRWLFDLVDQLSHDLSTIFSDVALRGGKRRKI